MALTTDCGRMLKLGDKKLAETYGASRTSVEYTCYCHHFTDDGKHCVLNGLGPEAAKKCNGVMYASAGSAIGNFFGVSKLEVSCGKQRGTHRTCRDFNCPFVKAGQKCPYSIEQDAK